MAEDKNPKRKKLSLQGDKKLSLGIGQDLIKSSRGAPITGTRSVQIETRRKRVSRKENIDQVFNLEKANHDKSQSNLSSGLTEKEKQARLNALKHGLQDLDDKNKQNKFLSKSEIDKEEIVEKIDSNASTIKKEPEIFENPAIQPTSKDVNNFERSKKQSETKSLNEETESKKERQKLKITVRRDEPRRRAGKITITDALSGQESRMRSLSSMRRQREKVRIQTESLQQVKQYRDVIIPDSITVGELAIRMSEKTADVVKQLMNLDIMATATQIIDGETAELVVSELGHKPKRVSESDIEIGLSGDKDDDEKLIARPPVVTIMGHVDHGKTSLLDTIKKSNVAASEAGGITQHIGAYQIETPKKSLITFIDTPGHAAFTEMRARGANITDIVVLVVAADDGIKDQTIEAINHAKAAKSPIIVAINKCDKPEADPNKVKTELLSYEIIPEDMGGETQVALVSAVTGNGISELIEAIMLQSEILELKSNPNRNAEGVVIEAKVEKGRGSVATLLITRGTLKLGDILVVGSETGRVRALLDYKGNKIKNALPSFPVEVLGLTGTPFSGDQAVVVETDARAREIAEYRKSKMKNSNDLAKLASRGSVEQMMTAIQNTDKRELPVVIKADVHGSLEAIKVALTKIGNENAAIHFLSGGVGAISESDVSLAIASNAILLGFNVRAIPQARDLARKENVELRYHSIIYELIDELTLLLTGILDPQKKEEFIGYAEVREIFNITKVGKIAGCMVTEGIIKRGCNVRLLRDNVVIHEGPLKTLKRFKDEVSDVREGNECGIALEKNNDIVLGDVFECFEVKEIAAKL
ncbi:MAG: translation initiation factor IF-2 [SAR116 cluster bacterium]|nr:translation initiation factor IF-2 [SAR116 cluster bacterium]